MLLLTRDKHNTGCYTLWQMAGDDPRVVVLAESGVWYSNIADEMRTFEPILSGWFVGDITLPPGGGPIEVQIVKKIEDKLSPEAPHHA